MMREVDEKLSIKELGPYREISPKTADFRRLCILGLYVHVIGHSNFIFWLQVPQKGLIISVKSLLSVPFSTL